MRIVITGNPGTGKTAIAAWLAQKLDYTLLSLTPFIRKHRLHKKNEVDLKKLRKALLPIIHRQPDLFLEGHLACEMALPIDYVIVTRCHPKILRQRLRKRHYAHKKLEEDMMAELLDYATQKSERNYRVPTLEIETAHRSIVRCGQILLQAIKLKKKKLNGINYQKELLKELKLR